MKYTNTLIALISCLLISHSAFAKVYKWTDDKGQVHYSEHPGANQTNEVIKPKTGHSDPVSYSTAATSTASTEGNNTAATTPTAQPVKDTERCEQARKNQDILQRSSRVQMKDEKGELRYLNPDELKQKMDEASKAIEESC